MNFLHHKKTTPAKRFLSLLCVLALCLGLLPVTALAVENAPDQLYVGDTLVSAESGGGCWTTNGEGNLTTSTEDGNWNVKYEPGSATLTLKDATIKGGSTEVSFGAGIYALCSNNQSVSLTIVLIGENTIEGNYGILVDAEQGGTNGIDASLIIKSESGSGSSSLNVTGSSNHGISVRSGSGNASLTIENVTVTASTSASLAAGVYVYSGTQASESPNLSLAVNGGSLTASGGSGSSKGIWFYVGLPSVTDAATKLTVGGNAIVDAKTGGISATQDLSPIDTTISSSTTDTNGGIVWNGKDGTVYGDVTLDKSLTINEGETLTVPEGSSLDCNNNLTNNGTILVESGGTLTGNLSGGKEVTTPNISAQPTGQTVTAGNTANFSVNASADEGATLTYQWQQKTSTSDWTDIQNAISDTYAITNTTIDMSGYQYRCVVTAGGVSVISSAATLTVTEPAVVPPSITTESLPDGEVGTVYSQTLLATGDTPITWSITNGSLPAGLTLNENGVISGTPTTAGTSTFTVKAENGAGSKSKEYTLTIQSATVPVTGVTLSETALSLYTGKSETLIATVTPDDATNKAVTWESSNADVATVDNSGKVIAVGAGETTITVTTEDGSKTATCKVTVKSRPSYNPPTVSEKTIDAIADAQPGETVTVDLSSGSTKLDKEVFETLAGKDVTLVVELSGGLSWTINGSDIPENAKLADIDLGVTMNSDGIPVDLINAITGERGSVQIELAHDGAFGFTMTLTAPLGTENAGYWANLYHFNESTDKMSFETAAQIGDDGSVSLSFSHASQYAIVIDDHNHGVIDLPFTDVSDSDWFYEPVCFVYSQGFMTGTSATTFEPNTPLSRAMLVAILHRLEGSPAVSSGTFTDVANGDWYAEAVNWAASVGVVNGFDDGTFQPNTAITREQMAAILRNYAEYKGLDVSASGDLSAYSDAANVSAWAKESMQWAVGEGLLSGMMVDTLQPQGLSTRAQVASVLQRYLAKQ